MFSSLSSFSLVCLVLQNSTLVLLTRYSKSPEAVAAADGERYLTSTVVLNQEIVKLFLCLIIFVGQWKALRDSRSQGSISGMNDNGVVYIGHVNRSKNAGEITSPYTSEVIPINNGFEECNTGVIKDNTDVDLHFYRHQYYYYYCNYLRGYMNELRYQVLQCATLKLSIPALLFTLQNYLIFTALTHLDPLTFLMLTQSKLIFAALFSVLLLGKKLSKVQWASLGLLVVGVILSQKDSSSNSSIKNSHNNVNGKTLVVSNHGNISSSQPTSIFIGVCACLLSGISSSFAGVYFEKVVKKSSPTLAIGNIHLCIFAIPFAFISMMITDVIPTYYQTGRDVVLNGGHRQQSTAQVKDISREYASFSYFRGYTVLVYVLVLIHAVGGLLVALVMKYAGNILKGFANAVTVVVSGVIMALIWGYLPTFWFCVGSSIVFASTVMYAKYDEGRK